MWRETTRKPHNRKIWDEEFADWLPERVFDAHVHVFNRGTIPLGGLWSCAGHDITHYELPDLERDLAELYPDRATGALCFGTPHEGYDRAGNDAYVGEACDLERFFPLSLYDPKTVTPDDLRAAIADGPFLGIKPYLNYVPRLDPNDVGIHDMLPAEAMAVIDELGAIVMLHIPRKARLADPLNQRQIVELCERWPRARIVLAHIGRAYYLKNVVGHLDTLKDLPNLWYDTAMVNHPGVLEHFFATVAPDKCLYGTDAPIALAPGKSIEINDQYTYVTPVPWGLSISDDHGKLRFTSFTYEMLRGIKAAAARAGLGAGFLRGFFAHNAQAMIQAAMEDQGKG